MKNRKGLYLVGDTKVKIQTADDDVDRRFLEALKRPILNILEPLSKPTETPHLKESNSPSELFPIICTTCDMELGESEVKLIQPQCFNCYSLSI